MKRGPQFYYLKPGVRETAKEKELTQFYIATYMGVATSTVVRALSGTHRMSTANIKKMAEALDMDPKEMIICDICQE